VVSGKKVINLYVMFVGIKINIKKITLNSKIILLKEKKLIKMDMKEASGNIVL